MAVLNHSQPPASSSSVAYDLSLFEERVSPELKLVPKADVKAKARRTRWQALTNAASILFVTAVAALFIGNGIFSRIQITELSDRINEQRKVLKNLQADIDQLENGLLLESSADQVAAYADANGMVPMDQSQMIQLPKLAEDQAEVLTEEEPGFFRRFFDTFKSLLGI